MTTNTTLNELDVILHVIRTFMHQQKRDNEVVQINLKYYQWKFLLEHISDLAAVRAETLERAANLQYERAMKRHGWDKHGDADAIRALPDAKGQMKAASQAAAVMPGNTGQPGQQIPADAAPAEPATGREPKILGYANHPHAEYGKRVVGAIIDDAEFRYLHEPLDWLKTKLEAYDLLAAELERVKGERDEAILAEAVGQSSPDKCPITQRPFFMTIEHPAKGMVPTYGGPFDSYTIPTMEIEEGQPWHEGELTAHHFDHDRSEWVEDDSINFRVIHEEALLEIEQRATAAESEVEQIKERLKEAYACIENADEESWTADNDGVPRNKEGWQHRYREEIDAAKKHSAAIGRSRE